MEWKEISIAISGFVAGLLFNLFVKIMPTYIDLSKENHELREKVRELESELEDERAKRNHEHPVQTKELQTAIDALKRRRKSDIQDEGL